MASLRSSAIPVSDPASGLRITEIFYSLQGEANASGLPTVFIRLTGCPLRCSYCDTTYSFEGGERLSLEHIIETAEKYQTPYICVTGGEPLAQPNCLILLQRLCDAGFDVSLETSGALDVSRVDPRVSKVLDLKTPTSGEEHRNLISNLDHLTPRDQIKFVICNHEDYEWSKQQVEQYQLQTKVSTVWFSPAFAVEKGAVGLPRLARDLAQWILDDKLPVRFQLQLHKLLWNDESGR
ncbi:7-carboxy-7-deazaguanine synthase QueE [Acinetobacter baumannii]|uniref:7-carboxy-7-deazaguanine synthase QueE n=1 Tax=Acinetobacter baumannii TaxID=470 RepID=UPI000DE75603|nr:7-carboxy-7-deazaguanine synthase QueE [Acinetobacter baumannii]EHU1489406.1 7-carboxy-7-deazaguanine synthase QueE [Acinetobacter baumannii]MBP4542526.1 7-carboxy-7-deazaguanine synthase QueE [Acinetobacter baumannii]MBP4718206.1 7-carboxy-7-deazaguanine synthase QueE [Acinetobacter baumannii]MCJ9201713.1 7-carboxy-7-deazaguanine synthase QueE [Acinetobacter baumannii]MCJ9352450.1 7-carboxy-7-deazaguanine synthase QueE [Acinetobacter baumannii]